MQSSYSVIKGENLCSGKLIKVSTNYENKRNFIDKSVEDDDLINKSFKNIGESIINRAKLEREEIINAAYEKAERIEREIYEKAYKEGLANGLEDGYKEAYEKNIEDGLAKAKAITDEAIGLLHNAKIQYEEYLKSKTEEILELSYSIAAHILNENMSKDYGMNSFIENILKDSRDSKSFVIRVNGVHKEQLLGEIKRWKVEFSLNCEIFLLEDSSIEAGNAVIEKENGRITVGVEKALESIKNEIF